jgi:hypothetical protein
MGDKLREKMEGGKKDETFSVHFKVHTPIQIVFLKVPKRDNFSLVFFVLSEPTWVCDLGSGEKYRLFYQMTPDFEG